MRLKVFIQIWLSFFLPLLSKAQQEIALLTPGDFNAINELFISDKKGWYFKEGNNADWASASVDVQSWQRLSPEGLSTKMADANGKIEGWFRFYFRLNKELVSQKLAIRFNCWAAVDAYLNGDLVQSHGNTGVDGKPFREFNPSNLLPDTTVFYADSLYVLAIHFVDEVVATPLKKVKSEDYGLNRFVRIVGSEYYKRFAGQIDNWPAFINSVIIICLILSFLFWLLTILNKEEKNLRWIAISTTAALLVYSANAVSESNHVSFTVHQVALATWAFVAVLSLCSVLYLLIRIFNTRPSKGLIVLMCTYVLLALVNIILQLPSLLALVNLVSIIVVSSFLVSFRKKIHGAQRILVIGLALAQLFTFCWLLMVVIYQTLFIPFSLPIMGMMALTFPLSLLVYVALRFREIIKEVRLNAEKVIQLTEQQKEAALQQKTILEEEVARQTIELRTSLENLRSTQKQLIQSEKMASLGELTAGIAHEIQNPLNFVNNFSEVNKELLAEMNEEMEKGNYDEVKAIAKDISDNEEKINHHGKRADAIVKGMLQHSRSSSGQKEAADINALCDEYLRLAYHGLRAKDKSFNATLKTDFDQNIGNIHIIPQDMGRVLLNLITNAFYAVAEKGKASLKDLPSLYEPTVSVSTKKLQDKVEIKVSDNGNGIPQNIIDKIFQPFFTTKPTGQGTGLGLSLAYDIVKVHGGELKVETKEGEGTIFIIQLPV